MPVDALQVEGLARHLQPPHVGLHAGGGVEHVGGDLIQPGRQSDPNVQLVRSPVAGQGGIQTVGQQLGLVGTFGVGDGLVGERPGPSGVAGVGPAPSEGRAQPGPVGVVDGPSKQIVQLGRHFARIGAVDVEGRGA